MSKRRILLFVAFLSGLYGAIAHATEDENDLANAPLSDATETAPAAPTGKRTASRGIASDSAAAAAESSNDNEYNFSWLDPDKKIYVLQNRKFRKAQRVALFLSGGKNLSNAYRTEYVFIPRISYWFSEQFGVEALYAALSNSDNSNLTGLRNASPTALPFVRETRSYMAGLVTWTPWYSKLNFFNKILYFDWFLNGGLGQVNTAVNTQRNANGAPTFNLENLTAGFFGTGMNFFLSKNFSVRLDLIGMLYSATGADNTTTFTSTNYDFTAGIGYMF